MNPSKATGRRSPKSAPPPPPPVPTGRGLESYRHLVQVFSGNSKSSQSSARCQYKDVYLADPLARVTIIKSGVAARSIDEIAQSMGGTKEQLILLLGLARATVNRRAREGKALSVEDGERVVGMARLIGQVQAMVEASGSPEGFDAAQWVGRWLEEPLPALGGKRPAEFMDTAEGQGIVSSILDRMQSGAYA